MYKLNGITKTALASAVIGFMSPTAMAQSPLSGFSISSGNPTPTVKVSPIEAGIGSLEGFSIGGKTGAPTAKDCRYTTPVTLSYTINRDDGGISTGSYETTVWAPGKSTAGGRLTEMIKGDLAPGLWHTDSSNKGNQFSSGKLTVGRNFTKVYSGSLDKEIKSVSDKCKSINLSATYTQEPEKKDINDTVSVYTDGSTDRTGNEISFSDKDGFTDPQWAKVSRFLKDSRAKLVGDKPGQYGSVSYQLNFKGKNRILKKLNTPAAVRDFIQTRLNNGNADSLEIRVRGFGIPNPEIVDSGDSGSDHTPTTYTGVEHFESLTAAETACENNPDLSVTYNYRQPIQGKDGFFESFNPDNHEWVKSTIKRCSTLIKEIKSDGAEGQTGATADPTSAGANGVGSGLGTSASHDTGPTN